jgi:hypothetical protein
MRRVLWREGASNRKDEALLPLCVIVHELPTNIDRR